MKAVIKSVFRLGKKNIVICELGSTNPMALLDHDFAFYVHGKKIGKIRIVGVSTATESSCSTYDLSYTGDHILPEHVSGDSYITDNE